MKRPRRQAHENHTRGHPENVDDRGVLAIGGSAGAVAALRHVVRDLPADLPAPVLVSLHVGENARSVLPRILSRTGPLPAHHAQDGEPLQPSRIYVAPPGAHLVAEDGVVRLSHGPRVNRHRPAVDVMFAAAARRWRERVVAVVLSGSLDDGAVGAALVERTGGRVVVQDPGDALFDSMPCAAMAAAPGATAVATEKLGAHVARLLAEGGRGAGSGQGEEHTVAEERMGESDDPGFLTEHESRLTRLTCPECGGGLARVDLSTVHFYRCHVGHRYGPRSLEAAQREAAESALWAALAMLEEHAVVARSLAGGDGDDSPDDPLAAAAERSTALADALRDQLAGPSAFDDPLP
jgi:two-component system, chemotaxis family, protein-glutamate methylesterase/glutaminase